MRVIHKYTVALGIETSLNLHEGGVIVAFQIQHAAPALWVMEDPKAPVAPRKVIAKDTGEEVPEGWVYIGTAQVYAGDLTFHLFAESNPKLP